MIQQIIANALITAAGYALVATGFAILFATTRFYNFSYAAIYTIAPYVAFAFHKWGGWNIEIAIFSGCVFAIVCGCILDIFLYKVLRQKEASPLNLMVASLGIYIVLQNCISAVFGDATRSLRGSNVDTGTQILGAYVTEAQLWLLGVAICLLSVIVLILWITKAGRIIRAVANNIFIARCAGINPNSVILLTTALASLLVASAGVVVSFDTDLTPRMGFSALLMGMIASIIGGVGNLKGAVVGSVLLAIVCHMGIWIVGSEWYDAIAFGTVTFFLVIRPQGLFGARLKKSTI